MTYNVFVGALLVPQNIYFEMCCVSLYVLVWPLLVARTGVVKTDMPLMLTATAAVSAVYTTIGSVLFSVPVDG